MRAWSLLSLVIEHRAKQGLWVYFDRRLIIVSLKRICLSIHVLEFCDRVSDRIFCAINFEWRKSHSAKIFGESLLNFFFVNPHFFVLDEYRFKFTPAVLRYVKKDIGFEATPGVIRKHFFWRGDGRAIESFATVSYTHLTLPTNRAV